MLDMRFFFTITLPLLIRNSISVMDKNMLKRVRHISPVFNMHTRWKLQNVTFGILSSASCLHYKENTFGLQILRILLHVENGVSISETEK